MTKYTYDAKLKQIVPIVESGPEKPAPAPTQPVVAPAAIPAPPVWQKPAPTDSDNN